MYYTNIVHNDNVPAALSVTYFKTNSILNRNLTPSIDQINLFMPFTVTDTAYWILGVSLKDKKRNEVIMGWHALLTKYERPDCSHVMRREDKNSMKTIMMAEVNECHSRG